MSRTQVLDQILMFRKWVKNIEKDSTLAMNFFLKLKFWKERVNGLEAVGVRRDMVNP